MAKNAIDIERLVTWALRDQGLGWSFGSGTDSIAGFAELGVRVDRSTVGAPQPSMQSDDDALIVQHTIERLPREAAALIIQFGRIGDRPDWCPDGVGQLVQKMNRRGQAMWIYEKPGDRRSAKQPLLVWQGWRQEQVDYWRSTYTLWRQSLIDMVPALNARMENHQALPPSAPAAPWNDPALVAKYRTGGPLAHHHHAPGATDMSDEYVINEDGEIERLPDASRDAVLSIETRRPFSGT